MSLVCAWCHKVLSENIEGVVTDGICPNCAADLQFVPQAFDRFLNTLPGPVLVVDEKGRVMGANLAAAAMVRLEPWDMVDRMAGQVLSCVYSELPGGCGHTTHCTGCAIRQAFEHTFSTGEAVREAPAFAHRRGPAGPVRTFFRISTERMGPMVLVQIEEADIPDNGEGQPPIMQ